MVTALASASWAALAPNRRRPAVPSAAPPARRPPPRHRRPPPIPRRSPADVWAGATTRFLKFGHDAFGSTTARRGPICVYNFGTFRFDSPRLIFDFLGGRMTYWLSVSTLPAVLAGYRRENRSILDQRLNLAPGLSGRCNRAW